LNFQEVLTEELVLTSRLFVLKIFAWSIGSWYCQWQGVAHISIMVAWCLSICAILIWKFNNLHGTRNNAFSFVNILLESYWCTWLIGICIDVWDVSCWNPGTCSLTWKLSTECRYFSHLLLISLWIIGITMSPSCYLHNESSYIDYVFFSIAPLGNL
jgi:hypothetical protein